MWLILAVRHAFSDYFAMVSIFSKIKQSFATQALFLVKSNRASQPPNVSQHIVIQPMHMNIKVLSTYSFDVKK